MMHLERDTAARAAQGARARPADAMAGHRRAVAAGPVLRRAGRGRGDGGAADRREPGAVDAGRRVRRAAPEPGRRAHHPRPGHTATGRRRRRAGVRAGPTRVARVLQGTAKRSTPRAREGRPDGRSGRPRHVAHCRESHVRRRAGPGAGPAEPAAPEGQTPRALHDHRLRRLGRRGQRRRHPPRRLGARRARVPGDSRGGAHRRRARAALPLALLAASVARRPAHGVRSLVVRPRAGRTGRRLRAEAPNGSAPTTRSTTSRRSWSPTASSW